MGVFNFLWLIWENYHPLVPTKNNKPPWPPWLFIMNEPLYIFEKKNHFARLHFFLKNSNDICFCDGHSDRKYFSDRSSSRKTRCLYNSSEISKFWSQKQPASPIEVECKLHAKVSKCQLISEWNFGVFKSPQIPTKFLTDFCPCFIGQISGFFNLKCH